MRKIFLLIVSFVIYGILPAQFKVNDTLFFVREINDSFYQCVFIDTIKNPDFIPTSPILTSPVLT